MHLEGSKSCILSFSDSEIFILDGHEFYLKIYVAHKK